MANSNKKILKIYAYGTFFYGFIGVQDNLASYINSDIKNRGEIILPVSIFSSIKKVVKPVFFSPFINAQFIGAAPR